MTTASTLDADQLSELLHELGRRLTARGVEGALYVVGGAAIALAHDARRVTIDLDCVASPRDEVLAEAREVALLHGLPDEWLNSRAAAWIPTLPPHWTTSGVDYSGLRIHLADARTLVAMKLISDRTRDFADLVTLFPAAGITRPEDALALVHDAYPDGAGTRIPADGDILVDAAAVLVAVEATRQ